MPKSVAKRYPDSGYYFDNRWYTSVASATTGSDSTRLSTPTGVVH